MNPSERCDPATEGVVTLLDDEMRGDLLAVLDDLSAWTLPAARWDRITSVLDHLTEVLTSGDVAGVREALVELELLGPVRAGRIGTSERVHISEPVRSRANRLIHRLTVDGAAASGRSADAMTPDGSPSTSATPEVRNSDAQRHLP